MGVDVGDRHRNAGWEAGRLSERRGEAASAGAQGGEVAGHFAVDHLGEVRMERREVVARGVVAVLHHGLVPGRAGVADLHPGELPDHPVGRLEQPVGGVADFRVLLENLQRFGEEPLAADLAAVALQPGLPAGAGGVVDLIRLGLAGVMLPQFHPGVGAILPRPQGP